MHAPHNFLLLLALVTLTACSGIKEPPREFALPEGNYERGQSTFIALACNSCHSAAGVDQHQPDNTDISFALGGESPRVTSNAELMTSIINPSHRLSHRLPLEGSSIDGVSKMKNYNEVMTVQQLVDLVAYLQPQYPVIVVTPRLYWPYYPASGD
jgi:sulfur-oxidizing protein SoxX